MNTKYHSIIDIVEIGIRLFVDAVQVSEYTRAAVPIGSLPQAEGLLDDGRYDADWLRHSGKDKWIKLFTSDHKSCGRSIRHNKRCNRIDIMFGRLNEWCRAATPYD